MNAVPADDGTSTKNGITVLYYRQAGPKKKNRLFADY
jgi:hypothetical protein